MKTVEIAKHDGFKYRVKMFNDLVEMYPCKDDVNNFVNHCICDEYVAYNNETFCKIIDEFLDAPKKKLTDADIKKDFKTIGHQLSKKSMSALKAYYNGRYELSKLVYSKLQKVDVNKIDNVSSVIMKFNIPHELQFLSNDDDLCNVNAKTNSSFIEIEISKDDTDA